VKPDQLGPRGREISIYWAEPFVETYLCTHVLFCTCVEIRSVEILILIGGLCGVVFIKLLGDVAGVRRQIFALSIGTN
jgi:hypothetical protein